jgi:molybdate transport system ATP-binding protein
MSLQVVALIDISGFMVEVNLVVERGETIAVLGPNGAGKSTLMRAIAGLQPIKSGHVGLNDRTWDSPAERVFVPPEKRSVGFVFQRYLLFDHLNVLDNVSFGLRATGSSTREARWEAASQLELMELDSLSRAKPRELSGGQAQRVALARALVTRPDVLLLDEPISALDVSARGAVRRDLNRWTASTDTCRVLVTHDPVDAYALADRVVVLEGGRVTQTGSLADLTAAPRSSYVADLVGTNLLRGRLVGDTFTSDGGAVLTIGATDAERGPAVASVRPAAIALHRAKPEGSPRNVWESVIESVDRRPERVRVGLAEPSQIAAEVTPGGFEALDAEVGDRVWASVKASEISVVADG